MSPKQLQSWGKKLLTNVFINSKNYRNEDEDANCSCIHIHWKSDEETSKSNVLFSDGIPWELQPRTDPIEK